MSAKENVQPATQAEKINSVFNRLRARLYSLMETAFSDKGQASAAKKSIKDYTAQAWTDITRIVESEDKNTEDKRGAK